MSTEDRFALSEARIFADARRLFGLIPSNENWYSILIYFPNAEIQFYAAAEVIEYWERGMPDRRFLGSVLVTPTDTSIKIERLPKYDHIWSVRLWDIFTPIVQLL